MPPSPVPIKPHMVQPLATRAQLERASEPWALTRVFATIATLILAIAVGSWIGSGKTVNVGVMSVMLGLGLIILVAGDYWWCPALVLYSLYVGTNAIGVPLSGMEIGFMIIAVLFTLKLAMKTLRKAQPEMTPELTYWLLFCFVAIHCAVIVGYSHINGVPLKNILKSYYGVLAPMALYGLLIRYCKVQTIRPVAVIIFFGSLFITIVSLIVQHAGLSLDPFENFHISFSALDQSGTIVIFRGLDPYLFTGSLAFWPAVRKPSSRALLAIAIILSLFGVLSGGGRLPLVCCIIAGVFFAGIRGRIWVAIPFAVCAVLISGIISSSPDLFNSLPPLFQRSLAPLDFSSSADEMNESLAGSNDWHKDLRDRSLTYWFYDTNSFWLGHGFKSWDPSVTAQENNTGSVDIERRAELAVEMGYTENMFSAITNIFGMTGLILYSLFFAWLVKITYRGYKLSPPRSDARALCEFSLINLLPCIFLAPLMGYLPTINLIYWQLGYLAARPYLAPKMKSTDVSEAAPEIPAFARPAFAEQRSLAPSNINRF